MYKIRKVQFNNHKVLGNLSLDFCDLSGKAVDTVIFAGENGCGKSTIINEIYKFATTSVDFPMVIEFELSGKIFKIEYFKNQYNGIDIRVIDNAGVTNILDVLYNGRTFKGIFSDVDINFHGQNISSVTSLSLDSVKESRRSSTDLPKQIKQLLIDIQAQDDADVSRACIGNPNVPFNELHIERRMPRFTKAFDKMFEGLSYSRIHTNEGQKNVIFTKKSHELKIDDLSSGEKQVVYRGCFLLKDINALNGAFVFIDEPEISLHPSWQEKIMDYYKGIFTNSEGVQTSQIFAVTHSPFIIHNENRKNDKVIVLARDEEGKIIVKDNAEYFKCDSMKAIQDAFCIRDFSAEKSVVYLEGRTDEKYFKKAVEVFGYDLPFEFKWVGYIDKNGQETNTGEKNLDRAFHFLIAQNSSAINVCLKDCDTNRQSQRINNVIAMSIPKFENSKGMSKGIENSLVLDDIDITPFYKIKEKIGDYGEKTTLQEFDKMAFCDAICAMDNTLLKTVFQHLKETIDEISALYN